MRNILIGALALIAAGIGLGAQSSTGSPSPQHITVTGCVERGATGSPTGTSGSAAASSQVPGPDTKFVLANVAAEEKPTGTTGEKAGAIADARSYRLDDADEGKIAPHLGHTVEISGTVEQQAAQTAEATASTATADAVAPKLKVETITMVASDCSKK